MKKFKVFMLCICAVFALIVVLTACQPGTAATAQPSAAQTSAAFEQPLSAQTAVLASQSKAACGCD